jgi:hypothetical protein
MVNGFPELVYQPRKEDQQISLGPDGTSLDLLRAVYRSPTLHLQIRLRAAIAALPFEFPKLAVTAQVTEQSFAEILDKRLAKINNQKIINGNPPEIEVKAPMPRLADRKYRRM